MKVDNKPDSILVKYDQADSLEHLLLLSGFVYWYTSCCYLITFKKKTLFTPKDLNKWKMAIVIYFILSIWMSEQFIDISTRFDQIDINPYCPQWWTIGSHYMVRSKLAHVWSSCK